jgi:hypothetical protein
VCFVLVDEEQRHYAFERRSGSGQRETWIPISEPGRLGALVERYLSQLL